ncbi:MAG: hypothetical protein IT372_22065 [Polyangiaceae bacterium]|nr:hypothetical protein [Polyangiaceae bacterium]
MATENNITLLDRAPSLMPCYIRALFFPRTGFQRRREIPQLGVARRGLRVDERHLASYLEVCGGEPTGYLPFLYPLSLLFGYHISIFAHRDFPLSCLKLLALRNRVLQHRRITTGESFDIEAEVAGQRLVAKGVELDVHSALVIGGERAWESVGTYFIRGRFGGTEDPPGDGFQPLESVEHETHWEAPRSGGWDFAQLSGDFNGVHYSAQWARLLGFKRDFSHTPRVVSECLRRLPAGKDDAPLRLDVAFKGPVYYGSSLLMKGAHSGDGYRFDLYCGGAERPAIRGALRNVTSEEAL